MPGDTVNSGQRAYDEQPSALNPLEKTIRRGLEKLGPHSSHPGLRVAATLSKGEKYVQTLREIRRNIISGETGEAMLRAFLMGGDLTGVDTDAAEDILDQRLKGIGGGPRSPRADMILTGPFDP